MPVVVDYPDDVPWQTGGWLVPNEDGTVSINPDTEAHWVPPPEWDKDYDVADKAGSNDAARKEWDDFWAGIDPVIRSYLDPYINGNKDPHDLSDVPEAYRGVVRAYLQELGYYDDDPSNNGGPPDPAVTAATGGISPGYIEGGQAAAADNPSGFDNYPFEEKIKLYLETRDPALRAEILAAAAAIAAFYAQYGAESYAQMRLWYDEIKRLLNDIDAGLYDPVEEQITDDFGEYWDQQPPKGPGSGPNAAALAYQREAYYAHDYATYGASGNSLHRRRRRSQTVRRFRLRKAEWIDPYPWIPGTGPEKQLFELLVRRRIYFIFQGQAPELEQGYYSTMAVPGFEPDFILPEYRVIIDPFSPFHHSLAGAAQRDEQKIALYEALGYRYYHPWALGPGEWSFDQEGVNHGRFSTEEMLNQMPELGRPPLALSKREQMYRGQGFRLGQNLGAGARSVAAANRARVKARELIYARGLGGARRTGGPKVPRRPRRRTL